MEIITIVITFWFVTFLNFQNDFSDLIHFWSMFLEAAVRRCSVKKAFLKPLQNSQENTCACNFIKKGTLA